jgi:hypothetical protein
VQLKKKISGHGSQGAWRQDERIGGKTPVVKQLTDAGAVEFRSYKGAVVWPEILERVSV